MNLNISVRLSDAVKEEWEHAITDIMCDLCSPQGMSWTSGSRVITARMEADAPDSTVKEAAPELLAALRRIAEEIRSPDCEACVVLEIAENAMAKAEGRHG